MSEKTSDSWGRTLYNFFRSLKLAIVLILFITLTSIISTLIVQGKELEFYIATYSRFTAWLIVTSGFDDFFKSIIFLAPSVLFFANLSTCTYHRFVGRLKKGVRKRYGPDILHIGLLVMIIGGIITFAGREEGFATLEIGDNISIPGGYNMTLTNFEFFKYENGSPKDWISTVKVEKGGKVIHEAFPIEVNRPLKIGNIKLYQSSYNINTILFVSDPEGNGYQVAPGQIIPAGEEGYIFKDVILNKSDPSLSTAIFDRYKDHEIIEQVTFSSSENIDIYTITGMDSQKSTGLQMVRDPGYYPILIGLLLLTLGLFITYIQKLGDNKL